MIIAVYTVVDPLKAASFPYWSTLELYPGLYLADLSWYELDLTIDVDFAAWGQWSAEVLNKKIEFFCDK